MKRQAGWGKGAGKEVGEVLRVLQSPPAKEDAQHRLQPRMQNTRGRGSSTQSTEADSTPPLRATQSRLTYGQRGTNKVFC